MYGTSMRENREIPRSPVRLITGRDAQGTRGGTPEMYERGKSDGPVVPANLPNKAAGAVAEVGEERGSAKGNTASKTPPGRSAGPGASSALERVREVARRDKDARVHGAAAPRRPGPAPEGLLGDPPAGRPGGGRGDVGRLWAGPGGQPAGSARPGASGALPGQAEQARLHPEGGRAATAVGYRLAGGQDRPAGRRRGVERRL